MMAKMVPLSSRRLFPAMLALGMVMALACGAASELIGPSGGRVGSEAPEFQGIVNWINSEPLTMEQLRGKVVLIDFWTYTCVNCIRTFPHLKEWYAKYADKGLVIVGVHAPEFEFEKLTKNVINSAASFGLEYPIAQDNDFVTWKNYSNRFWPAKYLIDSEGVVRYTHFGEGAYLDTENFIRVLLADAGADLNRVLPGANPGPQIVSGARRGSFTRELYGGYERNASPGGIYVAQEAYYGGPERVVSYIDQGDHENHQIYLQGSWFNGLEELRHARQTENYEDYIAIKFSATTVNAVVNPLRDSPFEVQVTIDGRPLSAEEAGPDVVVADGRSYFRVDEGRMYQVVALAEYSTHELRLSSNSDNFALFAFSFGAYQEGP